MEDDNEFNIYYQYNNKKEINKPDLMNDTYFLIEYQKNSADNLNFDRIENLLKADGVNMDNVEQIFIEQNKNSKSKIKLNPLSKANFNDYKNMKNIYLHFLIDEEEISKKNKYMKDIEKYNFKIIELKKNFNKISEEMKKIKNSNILSEKNIAEIINTVEKERSEQDTLKSGIIYNSNIRLRNSFINIKKKRNLYILYLYCSVFDLKKIKYEESDYFEEMKCIYNLFKNESNISATLIFEPLINLINSFNNYFEIIPDIIHININPNFINEELNYNNLGETINKKLDDLLKDLGKEDKLSKVKLLLLSILPYNRINEKIADYFKSVKTIIFPYNLKKNNEKIIFFYEFYKNIILNGFSVEKAFELSNHNNFKKRSSENKDVYFHILTNSIEKIIGLKRNKITINDNCALKLDFIRYNYHRIIGRNLQINNCIEKIKENEESVLVYGNIGAGKKSVIQIVGKYFFERNYFSQRHIQYIELYDLDDIEEILRNKIEVIQNIDSSNLESEIIGGFAQKILLIIVFNFIIYDFRNVEDAIKNIQNKYSNCIFLCSCTIENFIEQKDSNKIKLDKLKKNSVMSLLEYINEELFDYKEKKSIKELQKLKKLSDYPNYFFLEAMYFKKFGNEKLFKQKYLNYNKTNAVELLNDFINDTQKEFKLKNILPIFYILKLGIRDDILHIFFDEKEIDSIKNNLNYLIVCEADSNGNNYLFDGFFREKLKIILEENYRNKNDKKKEDYKNYLLKVLENYAKIFRYIVNNSDFPYNLCKEFHAGINQGFWFSIYNTKFKSLYDSFLENENNKNIYFDDIRYFNNIKSIFENSLYFEIIKENIEIFKEYISQIIICFLTILHFKNNFFLLKKILDIFERSLTELKLEKDTLRLKYFAYWSLEDPSYLPDKGLLDRMESQEKENKDLYNDMMLEINLIKIYNFIKESLDFKTRRYPSFEDCQNYAKSDNLNLIRLNILYGLAMNYKEKKYFKEANIKANQMNNITLKLLTLLELAEYHLNHSEFDEFNNCILDYEKFDKTNMQSNILGIIQNKVDQLTDQKNKNYKNFNKNKLYFYISEPFFYKKNSLDDDENNLVPLKTEANNSFYLKYNLKLKLPKEFEIIFDVINKDFLNFLENKFKNPSKLVYIGCDFFNKDGNLFYSDSDDFKAIHFPLKDFENSIKKFKNKADMMILGFINSKTIAKYFIKNKFPNVIYLNKLDIIENLFSNHPYFYFYFQRCFNNFVIKFLIGLDKKRIIDAFIDSYEEFKNELERIEKCDANISKMISELLEHEIIEYSFENENIRLFEEINVSRSNSLTNSNLNLSFGEDNDENNMNDFETYLFEDTPISDNKISYDDIINLKFNNELKESTLEFLINKRYYWNKRILYKVIKNLLMHKIINIYGRELSGKSSLCLDLCKYFYINNYFKSGIYYIKNINSNRWDYKEELKNLKNKSSNNKDNIFQNALIIFDDKNNLNPCLSYLFNPSLYIILVSKESIKNKDIKKIEKKILNNKNNKGTKSQSNEQLNNLNDICYINMDKNLKKDSVEEFFNYFKINLYINENKELSGKAINAFNLIKNKDQISINDIVKIINNDV